jgi:hypothetical protein
MSILALFEDGWASTRPSSSSVGLQVASSGTSVGGGGGAGGRDIFCSVGPAVNGRGRTRRGTGSGIPRRPQRASAWPLRAFSRKPRPPLFVCTAGAQQCGNATAVMATRWIIVAVQCTVPCPAAAAAWPFFSLSGTAPALLAAEESHGGAHVWHCHERAR